MQNEYSTQTHMSKDELMQILNEIDSEQQRDRKVTKDHPKEVNTPDQHPDPSNPFF